MTRQMVRSGCYADIAQGKTGAPPPNPIPPPFACPGSMQQALGSKHGDPVCTQTLFPRSPHTPGGRLEGQMVRLG